MTINAELVHLLVASQFPRWADLPVVPVEPGGWDNRSFRLGESLLARLPSGEAYAGQVEKEQRWLPSLAPNLPLEIPAPLALGDPDYGYPWRWSILKWIEGETATADRIIDLEGFAGGLARFLRALRGIDTTDGPSAGPQNFYRGGALAVYDPETRGAVDLLRGEIDAKHALAVWEQALATSWGRPGVWVHGDVSAGNLLVHRGTLRAVIDFGCLGVGDPACDLTIAWSFLPRRSRGVFRRRTELDSATWARGRGWGLWKALITIAAEHPAASPRTVAARHTINEILQDYDADHRRRHGFR